MSISTPDIFPDAVRNCRRCSAELAPGSLVCEKCQALVYSEQLERLAEEARALEARGEPLQARDLWLQALPLLPHLSRQAQWIGDHYPSLPVLLTSGDPEDGSAYSKGALRQFLGKPYEPDVLVATLRSMLPISNP